MCPKVRFLVTLQKRRDFFALPFVLIHIALLHRACNPTCLFCNKKKGQKRGVTMGLRVRRLLPQSHGALVRTSKRVCWRRVESAKSRRHRHGEHKEVQRRAFTFLSREEGVAHMSFWKAQQRYALRVFKARAMNKDTMASQSLGKKMFWVERKRCYKTWLARTFFSFFG